MGLGLYLQKNKRKLGLAILLTIPTIITAETSFGLASKVVGITLSATAEKTHSKNKGQYWQAVNDYRALVSRVKEEPFKESPLEKSVLFPDSSLLESWPLTKENKIEVTSAEGEVIASRNATRIYVSYQDIPQTIKDAILVREDRSFFSHGGINWKGKLRIPFHYLKKGKLIGSSGITEQVAKWMFTPKGKIRPERKGLEGIKEKVLEVVYATELDLRYSKEKILEFYVNNAYFGDGNYGIVTAASSYFGKEIQQLSLPESLFLAVLVNNPGKNPKDESGVIFQKREYLSFINSLHQDKILDDTQYAECKTEIKILPVKKNAREILFPDALRIVYKELLNGGQGIDLMEYMTQENPGFGFKINTSINKDLTLKLKAALKKKLISKKDLEGAAVILNNEGRIVAISGRRDFNNWGERNLATEAIIPMASTIKPFMYAIGYDLGLFNPDQLITDNYEDIENPPQNWDATYGRELTLEDALTGSNNIVTRKVYDALPFELLLDYLKNLGLDAEEYRKAGVKDANNNALGSRHATPLDVAAAYLVFNRRDAQGDYTGEYLKPRIVTSIEFNEGKIERPREIPVPVFDQETIVAIRRSLIRAAHKVIGNTPYTLFLKTGTYDDVVYAWNAGGFIYENQPYSFAVVAMNEKGKSMGKSLYAAQIVSPVVKEFFTSLSQGIKSAKSFAKIEDKEREKVCDGYNTTKVKDILSNAEGREQVLDDFGACAEIYELGSEKWAFFKFYQAKTQELLYQESSKIAGEESTNTQRQKANTLNLYQAVINVLDTEDFYSLEAQRNVLYFQKKLN